MRRTLVGMVVAVAVALVPAWAMAGNQEFAEEIAAGLRNSGQLHNYKIGVKFQEGTAWLRGHVASQEQMNAALKQVLKTPGVDRVVNNLKLSAETAGTEPASRKQSAPQRLQQMRQAAGALGADDSSSSPAMRAAAVPTMAGSQTAARIKQAATEPAWSRSHAVEVVPATGSQASSQVDRLATFFVPAPARAATATTKKKRSSRPTPAPSRASEATPAQRAVAPVAAVPVAVAMAPAAAMFAGAQPMGAPIPQYVTPMSGGMPPAQYDQPNMPNYAWPSYAAYPNYAALTYPKQYSPTAWPYIGPFYPYPQVPLGWRKVTLEWHDGWWQLDFDDAPRNQWFSGLFRAPR